MSQNQAQNQAQNQSSNQTEIQKATENVNPSQLSENLDKQNSVKFCESGHSWLNGIWL